MTLPDPTPHASSPSSPGDGGALERQVEAAKIEHEMLLARTIQEALLRPPPEVPYAEVVVHSDPARSIGGDFYHASLRPDGTLAVGVGDISGKGVPAALLMAMMEGILELLEDMGLALAELVPLLDKSLGKNNPGNKFLTLATAVVDPDGRLELINAGHCPVALLRADGRVELLGPTGPLLGLLPRAAWTTRSARLSPGDCLVFYSDGIAESCSPMEEEFGVPGVERTLTALVGEGPRAIVDVLLQRVSAHRAGAEAHDDVTLLVMRFCGGS